MKSKNWPHICQMDINMNLTKCQKSSVAAGCVKKSLFSTNCWDICQCFLLSSMPPSSQKKSGFMFYIIYTTYTTLSTPDLIIVVTHVPFTLNLHVSSGYLAACGRAGKMTTPQVKHLSV